ncbi:hypothetical protein BV898_14373 [Hypsibius exemplaris]|uniref:Uncharacterized protein n=1 Tax=Hypsibius exemplaris TaxID=2072580 RepID=A0A9X6RJI0_HYPEX|nr:hypothetical protein BV898_14373 [Hypsibius exemplaris]
MFFYVPHGTHENTVITVSKSIPIPLPPSPTPTPPLVPHSPASPLASNQAPLEDDQMDDSNDEDDNEDESTKLTT